MIDFEIVIRLSNSIFTIGIGLLLAYMYLAKKARFTSLLAWSIAFILYGIEIFARVWYSWSAIEILLLSIPMASLFILGTSNLIRQNKIYGIILLAEIITVIILFPSNYWVQFSTFAFFGFMTIAIIHLRVVIGKIADRLIVGWLILFISNLFFVAVIKQEWLADLLVIPAKGLLAIGMYDQRFARMILELKKIAVHYRDTASAH